MWCLQVLRLTAGRGSPAPGRHSFASGGPRWRCAQRFQGTSDNSRRIRVTFYRRFAMRMFGAAVLAIVSLFAAVRSQAADGEVKEEAVAKDLQAFKGTWRLSSRQEDGKNFSEEETKDVIATIDGSGK